MPEPLNPHWDEILKACGLSNVKALLTHCGPSSGALVKGLISELEDGPDRSYVQQWIAREEKEQQTKQERLDAKRYWWAQGMAIIALMVAILGWLFPHK
jgi:hypothetical protein